MERRSPPCESAAYPAAVPDDGLLESLHPLLPLLRVPSLEVEGLVVDGDGERAVVLVVYSDDGTLQADAAPPHSPHHLLLGLQKKKDFVSAE